MTVVRVLEKEVGKDTFAGRFWLKFLRFRNRLLASSCRSPKIFRKRRKLHARVGWKAILKGGGY
jgi:hypothetical protein